VEESQTWFRILASPIFTPIIMLNFLILAGVEKPEQLFEVFQNFHSTSSLNSPRHEPALEGSFSAKKKGFAEFQKIVPRIVSR